MIYKGNCRLGDLFESRREKGHSGLPTLSVTLNNGVVNREDLDRKQETTLAPNEHLLAKPGDISYNMMRMWQGAFGLVKQEGIVSPAYVVLRPISGIDSEYASYLFKTQRMIYLFWAYSYGLTEDRLRLYYPDFAKIPATIPSVKSQKKITRILATWDHAINLVERLIANSKCQRQALLTMLTTGARRLDSNHTAWHTYTLADLGSTYGGLSGKSGSDFGNGSKFIPYINVFNNFRIDINSLGLVTISSNEQQSTVKYGDVLFTTSSETPNEVGMASVLLDEVDELYLNSFCFGYRLHDFETLLPEYAVYLLRSPEIRAQMTLLAQGSTRFNISKTKVLRFRIRLPSLIEQRSIVKVLNCASADIECMNLNLQRLIEEKRALMNELMGGKFNVRFPEFNMATIR
jgi:type I restriction enzyme S subunit